MKYLLAYLGQSGGENLEGPTPSDLTKLTKPPLGPPPGGENPGEPGGRVLTKLTKPPPPGVTYGPDSILIDPPAWRIIVSNWPHERWASWRRRSGELEPPGATLEQIREAEHRAFLELANEREARLAESGA